MVDAPIRRFTLLVLFQAQMDRATELVIDPSAGESAGIRYRVSGLWHDLAPPPPDVLPGVVAELKTLAGLPERIFPKEGDIDLAYSGVRLRWKVRIPMPDDICLLTPM